ncbi:unnamed protein product [Paramecium sonneborni]|uniref:Uncharacterized protein n=1 Tax=Paramecium sonneborni TaxID=65129 RepID=A0A8S1RXC3_9CILI|nr:unnamed protein product [Paramecium sonneborni]
MTTLSKEFYCPSGTYLKFSFISGIFDSWDREYLFIQVDDEIIDKIKYFCFDGKYICRNTIWQDQLVEKAITFVSKSGKIKQKFLYMINQIILLMMVMYTYIIESWEIRDIRLEIGYPCVDFLVSAIFN